MSREDEVLPETPSSCSGQYRLPSPRASVGFAAVDQRADVLGVAAGSQLMLLETVICLDSPPLTTRQLRAYNNIVTELEQRWKFMSK